MAKKEKIKYWNIWNILSKEARYYLVIGERSNGKTYGTLEYCLGEYFNNGSEFAYIRRWDEDLVGKKGESLFNAHIKNGVIKKLSKGKWNHIVYKSRAYYLAFIDDEDKMITDNRPFAYAFALTQQEHYKSNSYPNIRNIVFDEFLTRGVYLPDEFVTFQNLLSTLIRLRDDVKIFMLGNTVNRYCPYFKEMGLSRIRNQKEGTIDVYEYGESGLKVAVEYASIDTKIKKSNVYFAFNNPRLEMIKSGAWEIDIYPHYPRDIYEGINPLIDVKYTFYIDFEDNILQCEIIYKKVDREGNKKPSYFLFIHPKTTPLKDVKKEIIYSQTPSPLPNYRRKLTKATSIIERKIQSFFVKDKVFYSDNETGEVMRNYLAWCKS